MFLPCSSLGWTAVLQHKLGPLWSLPWGPEEFLLYLVGQCFPSFFFFDLGVCRAVSPPFPPVCPLCWFSISPFLNMLFLRHRNLGCRSQPCPEVGPLEPSRIIWNLLTQPLQLPSARTGTPEPSAIHKYKYTSRYEEFF